MIAVSRINRTLVEVEANAEGWAAIENFLWRGDYVYQLETSPYDWNFRLILFPLAIEADSFCLWVEEYYRPDTNAYGFVDLTEQ